MDIPAMILSPLFILMLKMLLVAGLLIGFQPKLTATNQAYMWRMGLVLLLTLPWLNSQISVIKIPLLPAFDSAAFIDTAAKTTVAQTNDLTPYNWLPLIVLVSIISVFLIIRITAQLNKIKSLSDQGNPIEFKPWLKIALESVSLLGLQRMPKIIQSTKIQSPCTWGHKQPVILLPINIQNDQQLRIILLHEMAHIKRNDWLWMMASKIASALFWCNPLLWFIHHKLINSFESACDDLVLGHDIKPSHYVETLLHFHQLNHGNVATITTAMAQANAMFVRLQNILTPQNRRHHMQPSKQKILLTTAATVLSLITVSQLTFAQANNTEKANLVPSAPQAMAAPQADKAPNSPESPAAPEAPKAETAPAAPSAVPDRQAETLPTPPLSLVRPTITTPQTPAVPAIPQDNQPNNPVPKAPTLKQINDQKLVLLTQKLPQINSQKRLELAQNLKRLEKVKSEKMQRLQTISTENKTARLQQMSAEKNLRLAALHSLKSLDEVKRSQQPLIRAEVKLTELKAAELQ
ncbi:M56 family metallopeptidase [Marinicella litoralis]|uniref:Beta-lactamase regulating signal transducer with metallopeptidase domain n=1 Tax=Marinicella litoralis TaxID=644220 RepID=A0A4R6XY94_9GAMM|nr:M56 family metallopeptidase [Marinicella litoralis]TDR23609.1 beta-lactamase regulating signal transducer with metallopeptidase domain [Marinicella litoralis]